MSVISMSLSVNTQIRKTSIVQFMTDGDVFEPNELIWKANISTDTVKIYNVIYLAYIYICLAYIQ